MKIITPQLVASVNIDPTRVKIFKGGISFNVSAQKTLALRQASKFVLQMDDLDRLFYQDVIKGDAFEITAMPAKGGARASSKNLLKYLFPEETEPFVYFELGEIKNGMRPLIRIK